MVRHTYELVLYIRQSYTVNIGIKTFFLAIFDIGHDLGKECALTTWIDYLLEYNITQLRESFIILSIHFINI